MSQVKNKYLAQMAAHTYKGNNTGLTANPSDITSTQLTADLNLFSSTLQGLVGASGGGTTNFLRADGTWTTIGTATNATNVVTTTKSDNTTYYLTFVGANSSSNQGVDVGPVTINPSTSTITATTFAGTATNISATSNSTLTTLSSLSLPDTQVSGTSTQVQYIDSTGFMGGDTAFVFNDSTKALTLGVNGTSSGALLLATNTSSGASISLINGGATTAYNFKLPITVGTAGQVLTSQAGSAMTWTTVLTSAGYRAGSASLSSAATSKAITFSSTLGTTSYAVVVTMANTTDTNPQYIPVTITAISATGFTASWDQPTDTANYILQWQVILNN